MISNIESDDIEMGEIGADEEYIETDEECIGNGGISYGGRSDAVGEVLTPANIVRDMLDLVRDESYRIDSKFLEPAAGDGNFLVQILARKLIAVGNMGKDDYDRNLFIAVSSIYAIDIGNKNVVKAKSRMMEIIKSNYRKVQGREIDDNMRKVIEYLIDANIIWGNSLNGLREFGRKSNVSAIADKNRIVISDWVIEGDMVDRKDYFFECLQGEGKKDEPFRICDKINFRNVHEQDNRVYELSIDDL